MESLLDSVSVRILASVIAALAVLALYYSFDIYQFFSRKDFAHVNAYTVLFTRHEAAQVSRHDMGARNDRVVFELIGYKIPLREIFRNRFLFWVIMFRSMRVTVEQPVLNFGKRRNILAPVRGRVSQTWASMVLKRASGLPFRETPYQLSLVYDRSEDSTNFVLRVILIQDRDIENFSEYLKKPPMNTDNFSLVARIVKAHEEKTGSFINTRVTTA